MGMSFFNRIKKGLEKTRKSFVKSVETVVIGYAQIDDDFKELSFDSKYEIVGKIKRHIRDFD